MTLLLSQLSTIRPHYLNDCCEVEAIFNTNQPWLVELLLTSVILALWLVRFSPSFLWLAECFDLPRLWGYLRYNSELIANQMLKNLIKSDWCLRPIRSSSIRRYFSNISWDHSTPQAHGLFILITLLAHKDPDDSRMTRWSLMCSPVPIRIVSPAVQAKPDQGNWQNCQLGGVSYERLSPNCYWSLKLVHEQAFCGLEIFYFQIMKPD